MQIDRGKTEKAFGPLRPPNSFSDMNTRGTGLGGDPIFADLFAQKPKGQYPSKHYVEILAPLIFFIADINGYIVVLIGIVEN